MNYELKDKINVTQEFVSELEKKSWQEIEHLQAQIANLAEGRVNDKLRQLFNNLLTSYYVFTGGLENLSSEKAFAKVSSFEDKVCVEKELITTKPAQSEIKAELCTDNDLLEPLSVKEAEQAEIEPFEYFVDFDEPIGDPISDEDLYGN